MSGMFYTGLSGLSVARAGLLTTANNTANVYTEGYSRQTAQVATNAGMSSGAGFIGSGARITTVSRSYDQYLSSQLTEAESSSQALDTYATQIKQIDALLSDRTAGLSPLMQSFFTSVQGVANTPADPAARQQLISSAQTLANKFRSTDQYLTDRNASINDQIVGSAEQINTYSSQIARLNQQISQLSAMAGGQPPNDLLDQRDKLLSSLSKVVGVKVVEQDGGQYNVYMGTGQALVLGDRAATVQAVASAADPTRKALAWLGASGHLLELSDSALTGGSLGALLAFRSETLVTAQNSLGRIAIALADTFNAQQKLGVDLNGALGTNFFSQASPGVISNSRNAGTLTLTAAFSDTSKLTASDYRLDVAAGPAYTVTRLSDNKIFSSADLSASVPANTFDGVTLTFAGAAAAGDSFLIQPTRTGARDLTVMLTDPAKVAAASPIITGNTAGNQGSGAISAGTVDANYLTTPLSANVTLAYNSATNTFSGFPAGAAVTVTLANGSPDPASPYAAGTPVTYAAGAKMTFNGITVTINGAPSNNYTFSIGKNTGGVSDGSNALLLGALQRKTTLVGGGSSFSGAYAQLASTVGSRSMQVQVAQTAQNSVTGQIRASQQSISGVNQDEETANLLRFQQMYQANAKVIQTASTMFDAILGIR